MFVANGWLVTSARVCRNRFTKKSSSASVNFLFVFAVAFLFCVGIASFDAFLRLNLIRVLHRCLILTFLALYPITFVRLICGFFIVDFNCYFLSFRNHIVVSQKLNHMGLGHALITNYVVSVQSSEPSNSADFKRFIKIKISETKFCFFGKNL